MTCFTDLATGDVLDVVDGRDCAAVRDWLGTRPRWWRHRVEVVAIDPSAAFRSAVAPLLPNAAVSVDHFHLVKLANDMVTDVRRRVSWDRHHRRGRKVDLAWAHRLLLLRGYDTLSEHGRVKLDEVLARDDPTREIPAAWGVKEQLRRMLATTTPAAARNERARFDQYVTWAATAETTRLKKTIHAWWPETETFIGTRATNARTEAANVTIKNIKRTGRGYRSPTNYRSRIMLYTVKRVIEQQEATSAGQELVERTPRAKNLDEVADLVAGDARPQVIHLALTLAAYEAATIRDDWRHPTPHPPPAHPPG